MSVFSGTYSVPMREKTVQKNSKYNAFFNNNYTVIIKIASSFKFSVAIFPFGYIAKLLVFNRVPLINTFSAISLKFFHLELIFWFRTSLKMKTTVSKMIEQRNNMYWAQHIPLKLLSLNTCYIKSIDMHHQLIWCK